MADRDRSPSHIAEDLFLALTEERYEDARVLLDPEIVWLTAFRPGRSRLFGPGDVIAFAQDLNRQLGRYEIQAKFTELPDGRVHGQVIVLRDALEDGLLGPAFEVAVQVRDGLVVHVETMPPGWTRR